MIRNVRDRHLLSWFYHPNGTDTNEMFLENVLRTFSFFENFGPILKFQIPKAFYREKVTHSTRVQNDLREHAVNVIEPDHGEKPLFFF